MGVRFGTDDKSLLPHRLDQRTQEVAGHRDAEIGFQSASPDDLFMLIFTSGTSGNPKAVMCSHGKVAVAGTDLGLRMGVPGAPAAHRA